MFQRTTIVCRAIGVAILLLVVPVKPAAAQDVSAEVRQAVEVVRRTNPQITVRLDPNTGLPASIKGLTPRPDPAIALTASFNAAGEPSEADVRRAVEAFIATSEIVAAFPERNAQTRKQITQFRRDPDIPGQSVVHVTQRVGGIQVFGSSAKYVVNRTLAVTDLTASYSTVAIESTTASITESEAIATARRHVRQVLTRLARDAGLDRIFANIDTIPARAELAVFDPALLRARGAVPGPLRLTWLVSLDALRVFVDAVTGNVGFYYRDHPSFGTRRVFDLSSGDTFPGKKVLDEESRERGEPLALDALHAFQNTGAVRDFFYLILGRKALDTSGSASGASLESYVRFSSEQNARWCKDRSVNCPKANTMVYGPGFAAALDVVGHEVTHGIIAHESDLVYADEPGAVNEALADIFGTLIELHAREGRGNWVMGEGLPGFSEASPMRSLADPHLSKGPGTTLFNKSQPYSSAANRGQPDHYSEYVARTDPICDTTWDYLNGCVHFNSGILNKFAYLISEGGRQKDVTVTGVGRNKLARIAYRALTARLNATSGLVQAAEAFVAACSELAAASVAEITTQDCVQVEKAQLAVGLAPGS